ncbi:Ribonuclease H-like domain [Trinorchestia longiramus]|nr:Ribonuclease H-like domain [Trinorchestia longiramus]
MSAHIADQVVERVKFSKYGFVIQLDESTDVTNCSQLLVYVRFTPNNAAKTELLLNQDLSSTTTGKDIFNVLDNFFKQNELDWEKLDGCTTDEAPSMFDRKSEVRWLSRDNTARRLFELRDELLVFFTEKEHDFQTDLEDEDFISRLAYLSDIFGALNHLNLSFQGPDCTVTEFISKLGAFIRKLDLWMKNVESKRYGMFELLTALESEPTDEFAQEIVHHFSLLKTELKHYFPDVTCCTC